MRKRRNWGEQKLEHQLQFFICIYILSSNLNANERDRRKSRETNLCLGLSTEPHSHIRWPNKSKLNRSHKCMRKKNHLLTNATYAFAPFCFAPYVYSLVADSYLGCGIYVSAPMCFRYLYAWLIAFLIIAQFACECFFSLLIQSACSQRRQENFT